jgi:hypothetical protein
MNVATGSLSPSQRHGRGRGLVALCFVLLITGLFNNPPWKGYSSERRIEFNTEPVRIAASLQRDGEFANPFATPAGSTAQIAPGLPFLQYLILRLLGDGSGGWLAIRCLAALALSCQLALLPWLAPQFGYSVQKGVLASVFGLLVKPGLEEQWEAHIAGLAAILLTAAACIWLKRTGTTAWAWTVGVLAGLAACFNPVIGAVYLAWVIGAGRSSGFLNRRVLPLWLLPLLILAPWSLRNAVVMGGLVPVRDNLGLELYVSFNDCARYGFRENMRISCIQNFHPNSSIEEALAVGSLGEYRYNRDRLRRAVTWASLHPARAAGLTAQRIWYFWFPSEYGLQGYGQQRIRMLALHALTITSFFGVYCSLRRRRPSDFYILSWVVIFPLIYYLVQFDYRYRYPILWATWLLAADGILLAIASIGATSFLFRRAGDVRHAAGSMLSS